MPIRRCRLRNSLGVNPAAQLFNAAGLEIPAEGLRVPFLEREWVDHRLGLGPEPGPIRVSVLAGNAAHRWHNGPETTAALLRAWGDDPRITARVCTDPADLPAELAGCGVLVLNWCNWHDPAGMPEAAKTALQAFVAAAAAASRIILPEEPATRRCPKREPRTGLGTARSCAAPGSTAPLPPAPASTTASARSMSVRPVRIRWRQGFSSSQSKTNCTGGSTGPKPPNRCCSHARKSLEPTSRWRGPTPSAQRGWCSPCWVTRPKHTKPARCAPSPAARWLGLPSARFTAPTMAREAGQTLKMMARFHQAVCRRFLHRLHRGVIAHAPRKNHP